VTGRLVPPKDPAALAEAINPLLEDDRRRAALGRAGRDRARARYTWDRVAADSERVYEKLAPLRREVSPLNTRSG
jgi:glycosyltransferase involved in cell wall biosynthesis